MMTAREQYEKHKDYIEREGLDNLVDFQAHIDYEEKPFDMVSGKLDIPFPAQAADLVRIHKLIRSRRPFTVMEFGPGYSTVVIADALAKNKADWEQLPSRAEIRNRYMFQLFSVDSSESWIHEVQQRLPTQLRSLVHFHYSQVHIGTFQDRICHYFDSLPDIVADFYYLDGPMAKDVQGAIGNMTFQCLERTVMAADLLRMEPTFLPGTFILVDGRTNNARFLERNFQRDFKVTWDPEGDVTTFELNEPRLGKYNILGSDFFPARS